MRPLPPLPSTPPAPGQVIPRRVHLTWVGSAPPPHLEGAARRWRALDLEVFVWTRDTVTDCAPLATALALATHEYRLTPRSCSDVLRLYATSLLGGWYFDLDLVPLRPLPHDLPAQIYSDDTAPTRVASCGAFGFTAGHPFLATVLGLGQQALDRGVRNDHFTFGPRTHDKAHRSTSPTVPVAHTISIKASADQRRAMARGDDLDLPRLRAEHPDATVAHVGLPGSYP